MSQPSTAQPVQPPQNGLNGAPPGASPPATWTNGLGLTPAASPALPFQSPVLLSSSPYLRSMALLDNQDLQSLMAGGDLREEEAARLAARNTSPEATLNALAAITARSGHTPPGQYDSLSTESPLRRVTSHDQLTATAAAVAALSSPRETFPRPTPRARPPPPDEEVGEQGDAKRRDVRRERNREHARISRERKRQKLEHLQEENDALRRKEQVLVDERNRLRVRLDGAEHENAGMRAYIQRHRHLLGDVASALLAPAASSGG